MKTRTLLFVSGLCLMAFFSPKVKADTEKQVYVPAGFTDINDTASDWCMQRSIQEKDVILFWGKGYGTNDPNSTAIPEIYRVDVRDMIAKLEQFYQVNVNTLKFATVGKDSSQLDKYKFMAFLLYTTDWVCTGAGYDNVIGALWMGPTACHPAGSGAAHEMGHSFQYQVYCDYLYNHGGQDPDGKFVGFRYTSGGSFWETSAQWQSYQCYPEEFFNPVHFDACYKLHSYYHPFHEWWRYANYPFIEWMVYKHGIDGPARVWQNSQSPEDASQVYMRVFYGDATTHLQEYGDELYDMASRYVTWDIPTLRERGKNYIGAITTKLHRAGKNTDGNIIWQVDSVNCVQEHGFNHIELNVPQGGGKVMANFKGVAGIDGYNKVDYLNAGWRYGFVALLDNGERVYSDMHRATNKTPSDTATFDVPANTSRLWMVVLGAPSKYYRQHPWDEDASNDEQWPYQVSFDNTNLLGFVTFDPNEGVHNATVTYNINVPVSTGEYQCFSFKPDLMPMYHAFQLEPDELSANLGKYSSTKNVRFCNINADGSIYNGYTTNTSDTNWGGWFGLDGNVCTWGDKSYAYCDFNTADMSFTLGRYPNKAVVGDTMTIRQAFIYKRKTRVTFQMKLNFVAADQTAQVTKTEVTAEPTGINTPIRTVKNNAVYDLQGRMVDKTGKAKLPKGVYISNGRVFVK
jgi:hypothetical protein